MENNQVAQGNRYFWLGKIFSLFGILPLGIYVVIHLYRNLSSLGGEESFNHYIAGIRSGPTLVTMMILVVWVPIAFHGLYGLFIMKNSRPNLRMSPYFRNLKYVLQRLSGIGLLLFIPAHIYKTRFEPGLFNSSLDFHHMVEGMHEPLTLGVYLLGVLGVAYHLANGVWQFSIGWGVATTARGMRRMEWISYGIFALLLVMGYLSIWGFFA